MIIKNLIQEKNDYLRNWIDVSSHLIVGTSTFEYEISDEQIIQYVETIALAIRDTGRGKVCFDIMAEGMPFGTINTINRIVKRLIDLFSFEIAQFKIIFGGSHHYKNYEFYLESVRRFNWLPIHVIFANNYELLFSARIGMNPDIYQRINQKPKIKNKKFLCYNRNVKAHRLYITAILMSKNLIDKGFFSMYMRGNHEHGLTEDTRYVFNMLEHYFPQTWQHAADVLDKNYDKFPITLSLRPDNAHNMHEITEEDFEHYNDAYFGIITETKYFHDNPTNLNMLKADLSLDGYLFSEKTYKFIAGKLPFIMVGVPGSLQALRDLGYQTFYPYIDETYDTIYDDEERMIAILVEIERLCGLGDDKWLIIQDKLQGIVEHNFNVLKNAYPKSYSP
jgi:hypothetical protein